MENFNAFDLSLIFDALLFSAKKHRTQKRKDVLGTPYINHPIGVARNISFLSTMNEKDKRITIIAGILHDTIEDTDTSFEEIEMRYGKDVAELVAEVTNDKNLTGEESKKNELTRVKTLSVLACAIRISDKIENIKDIDSNQPLNWDKKRKIKYCQWCLDIVNNIDYKDDFILQLKYTFMQRYFETLDKLL